MNNTMPSTPISGFNYSKFKISFDSHPQFKNILFFCGCAMKALKMQKHVVYDIIIKLTFLFLNIFVYLIINSYTQ